MVSLSTNDETDQMAKLCMQDVVESFLKSMGIKSEADMGKKHIKIRFYLNGQKRMYVCSRTPSDHRTADNAKADLKRMFREASAA